MLRAAFSVKQCDVINQAWTKRLCIAYLVSARKVWSELEAGATVLDGHNCPRVICVGKLCARSLSGSIEEVLSAHTNGAVRLAGIDSFIPVSSSEARHYHCAAGSRTRLTSPTLLPLVIGNRRVTSVSRETRWSLRRRYGFVGKPDNHSYIGLCEAKPATRFVSCTCHHQTYDKFILSPG